MRHSVLILREFIDMANDKNIYF